MRKLLLLAGLALVLAIGAAAPAAASEWHSEQPAGAGIGVPIPLGEIGDIEFWAPNHGLLITAGNDAVAPGIFAYDGTGWYRYATVCGGHQGRIAFAGPNDFWTISDQRAGQAIQSGTETALYRRSLCHFENGRVVASYAEPLDTATSYEQMNAAICDGPDNCWFGGERLPGSPNVGAFHLHWDGTSLSAVPSLTVPEPALGDPGRAVTGLALDNGQLYESVRLQEGDQPIGETGAEEPSRLHEILPGLPTPFLPLYPTSSLNLNGACPAQLGPLRLADEGGALWGVAGDVGNSRPESGSECPVAKRAPVTVLRLAGAGLEPVRLKGPYVFEESTRIEGAAAEPLSGSVWVSARPKTPEPNEPEAAHLVKIHADGTVDQPVVLPAPGEGLGQKGAAGPIACSGPEQCWTAAASGWLFHLGEAPSPDLDPAWHPPVIEFRPPDGSVPAEGPDRATDDSGLEEEKAGTEPLPHEKPPHVRKRPPLVKNIKQRMVGKLTLQIAFELTALAEVRLIAEQKKKVVAATPLHLLRKGRHRLRLKLDPKHWPTAINLHTRPVHYGIADAVAVETKKSKEPLATATTPAAEVKPVIPAALEAEPPLGGPAQTVAFAQAPVARILGPSPLEAPGEVWGLGEGRPKRYANGVGWETVAGPVSAAGAPLTELAYTPGALAGRTTAAGGVAIFATVGSREAEERLLIVRDPGGAFRAAPSPGTALGIEEALFSPTLPPLVTPVGEPDGHTGAFVVPAPEPKAPEAEGPKTEEPESEGPESEGPESEEPKPPAEKPEPLPAAVLHYDGNGWTREPICAGTVPGLCLAPPTGFKVLAIDAADPTDAWLLATGPEPDEALVLMRREASQWRRQPLGGSLGSAFSQREAEVAPGTTVVVEPRLDSQGKPLGQALTVTEKGVWVDARLKIGATTTDATFYYDSGLGDPQMGQVSASWCDPPSGVTGYCSFPLGSELSAGEGRSFAWPGSGGPGDFGRRTITGLPGGVILVLEGSTFKRVSTLGTAVGASTGAGLTAPEEGWLGPAREGSGEAPVHLTPEPEPDQLQSWSVPFRRPLTAIAPQPGVPVGALGSQALAVGDDGEVARYLPGQGWTSESLLSGSGARAKPRLRAVAWPEAGRAFAVGDEAEMWVWQAATGLWEPDPAKPPNLARANFTGIAFDPNEPQLGYAVGKQGVLLRYGRQWTQEPLPAGVDPEVNFTSIAFAGNEALAAYKFPLEGENNYEGGLLVNDGSGWRVDTAAAEALKAQRSGGGLAPELVAGLPDGGAVVASESGGVITREGSGSPWQPAARPAGSPVALAAFREGGQVRALVSAELVGHGKGGTSWTTDAEQIFNQPPPGQAPLLTSPYPLPASGFLLRQTATGWRDEEHRYLPVENHEAGEPVDLPVRPDAVLALLLEPEGGGGWAVGGETGEISEEEANGATVQTAGVMRYGVAPPPAANVTVTQIKPSPGAQFAIGGNAQCTWTCADLTGTGIGPERWLKAAVARARSIPGVRAFIDTGPGLAGRDMATRISPQAFRRESRAYAARLEAQAVGMPVFAAPASTDVDGQGSLESFLSGFAAAGQPLGLSSPGPGITPLSDATAGHAYYSFESAGTEGLARVLVLDYSQPTLGEAQECWLAQELSAARSAGVPAIVVGNRPLDPSLTSQGAASTTPVDAAEAATVVPIIVSGSFPSGCPVNGPAGGASAYFFDLPEQNREYQLSSGGHSIPAFGSGTLGYVGNVGFEEHEYIGASGFLLVSVGGMNATTGVAPVNVRLIPSISELALDATDGTLLQRSHVALFDGLARRPHAGMYCSNPAACVVKGDPYVQIPAECQGRTCANAIYPEYRFSSSNPDIADFVRADPSSSDPRRVLTDANGEAIPDPTSGLLCGFNAGTTTVSLEAGGLVYSVPVTVQPGTVLPPCGTVPLRSRSSTEPAPAAPPPPAPTPNPQVQKGSHPIPPPPPPAPGHPPARAPNPTPLTHPSPKPIPKAPAQPFSLPYFPKAAVLAPLPPIIVPVPPPAVQPTPPSGTSPVTQPAVSPEPEEEEEAAFDLVHHMAALAPQGRRPDRVLSHSGGHGGVPMTYAVLPLLALIAALGGAGVRRRRRPEMAYHSVNSPTLY